MSTTEAFFASRSMRTLEILAFGPSTATQVATELQVHPRTARRLLNRMVSDGWLVRRDGARPTYTPTLRIVALAAQHAHRAPLVTHAIELMEYLRARTGAAVHLAVPCYRSTLRLVRVREGRGETSALRDLAPAHSIAAGKLLLAFRPPWRDFVLGGPLARVTDQTIVDATALRGALDATSEQGHAIEDQEFRLGTRAIAFAVHGAEQEVVAALAISSPQADVPELLGHSGELEAVAEELSERLMREAA